MAPSKLSDADKRQITELYCQPGETTSTLANKFDISSSTVSRVLRQLLSKDDYAQLMQWKRSGECGSLKLESLQPLADDAEPGAQADAAATSDAAIPSDDAAVPSDDAAPAAPEELAEPVISEVSEEPEEPEASEEPAAPVSKSRIPKPQLKSSAPKRRSQRRVIQSSTDDADTDDQLPLQLDNPESEAAAVATPKADFADRNDAHTNDDADADTRDLSGDAVAADWDDDDIDTSDDYEDDFDDDLDDDEDDEADDWDDDGDRLPSPARQEQLQVLPFNNLVLKKPCYLVVDRLSELITCPLRDFGELGLIPEEEKQARTLPVFDNHRIARRFSRRNQRIVKVPDGMMLNKTQQYLHAKGITRILFDGRVYALI